MGAYAAALSADPHLLLQAYSDPNVSADDPDNISRINRLTPEAASTASCQLSEVLGTDCSKAGWASTSAVRGGSGARPRGVGYGGNDKWTNISNAFFTDKGKSNRSSEVVYSEFIFNIQFSRRACTGDAGCLSKTLA